MLTFVMKGTVGRLSRPLNRQWWRMCAVQYLILRKAWRYRNEGWEIISKKEHTCLSISLSPPSPDKWSHSGGWEWCICRMGAGRVNTAEQWTRGLMWFQIGAAALNAWGPKLTEGSYTYLCDVCPETNVPHAFVYTGERMITAAC